MQLIYDLDQGNGAMPIRWCLDEDEQTKIVDERITDLYVIIDVFYGTQDTDIWAINTSQRFVLPIDRYMQFVPFNRADIAHVCVALVSSIHGQPDEKQLEKMHSALIASHDKTNYFKNKLFRFRDQDESDSQTVEIHDDHLSECYCRVISFSHERIEVPQEYFAQPFTGWLKWWVEWIPRDLLRRKLVDQCDQRRWAIFAFTLQPFVFVFLSAVSLILTAVVYVATVMTGLYWSFWRGYGGVDWSAILRNQEEPKSVKAGVYKSSRYDYNDAYEPRPFIQRLVQPSVAVLVFGGILTATSTAPGEATAEINWPLFIAGLMLALIGLIGFWPSLRSAVDNWAESTMSDARERRRNTEGDRKTLESAKAAERMKALVADLSCPVVTAGAAVDTQKFLQPASIPAEHRTLRLRLDAIKAHVCKPLAR